MPNLALHIQIGAAAYVLPHLQIDEAGQLMEYDGRALSNTWAGKGDLIKKPESVNRTSFSIMPCADCMGFLYSLQMLFAAAGLHESSSTRRTLRRCRLAIRSAIAWAVLLQVR